MGRWRLCGYRPMQVFFLLGVSFLMWQTLFITLITLEEREGQSHNVLLDSQHHGDVMKATTIGSIGLQRLVQPNQNAGTWKKENITSSNMTLDRNERAMKPNDLKGGIILSNKTPNEVDPVANKTNGYRSLNATLRAASKVTKVQDKTTSKDSFKTTRNANQNKTPATPRNRKPAKQRIIINATEELELERSYYKKAPDVVFPFIHTFLVEPSENPCVANGAEPIAMVIVVNSKVTNVAKRAAIRETWGKMATGKAEVWPRGEQSLPPMALLFFLGVSPNVDMMKQIEAESQKHGDIVLGDFKDDYKNMTLKSMLCLKYLKLNCLSVPYVMKSDDDMFLNLPYVTSYLREHPLQRSFMGPHNPGSLVNRKGKWMLTKKEFPPDVFPPYESGSAYIQTMDLTVELFETAHYIRPLFIDDVFITGIVAKLVGNVHREVQKGFAYGNDKKPQLCDIVLNKKFAQTKCPPDVMKKLWTDLVNPSVTC